MKEARKFFFVYYNGSQEVSFSYPHVTPLNLLNGDAVLQAGQSLAQCVHFRKKPSLQSSKESLCSLKERYKGVLVSISQHSPFSGKRAGILVRTCGKAKFLQEKKKANENLRKKHYLLCTSL